MLPHIWILFLLVAELLAIKIRKEETINGIVLNHSNETKYKLSMIADDTTLIVNDIGSLDRAIGIFFQFKTYSGLKLNLTKKTK